MIFAASEKEMEVASWKVPYYFSSHLCAKKSHKQVICARNERRLPFGVFSYSKITTLLQT